MSKQRQQVAAAELLPAAERGGENFGMTWRDVEGDPEHRLRPWSVSVRLKRCTCSILLGTVRRPGLNHLEPVGQTVMDSRGDVFRFFVSTCGG